VSGKLCHLTDGREQEAHDKAMHPELKRGPPRQPDPIERSVWQWWSYVYDAEVAITEAWKAAGPVQHTSYLKTSITYGRDVRLRLCYGGICMDLVSRS